MITFKQFLVESRSAPLYHGTYIGNLQNIILKGQGIKPKTMHDSDKLLKRDIKNDYSFRPILGISTSRSFDFATEYKPGVVIELDQRLVSQRYQIKPIQFWLSNVRARGQHRIGSKVSGVNEYEEFIITDKPLPIKYIKCIWVGRQTVTQNEELLSQIQQQYGSSFIRTH